MDHGSEKEESKDPFFPSDDSGDDEVSGKGRKQRRPAGEKVAPKDRNGLVKAKLPTVMRKLETLAKETGGAYLLLYHHEAPTKAGKMEKRYILEGTRSFCKLLGKPKGDGTYEVLEPVVAAAYAFKFGDSSAEVAELRRMDATDFSNEKQVKAAALELLKRLLVIQLSLPEKRSVGQPFKLYSNARNSDPELPQVPKGWPTDAAVSFNSDCFHNRTTRKTANAIYNSIRMELISVLEAKDNGGSQPVKPHPKVTMPARMITGAIRNISSRAAATGAQAESEAAPQTGRGDGSAAAAVDGTYVPTGILAAGGPSARVQAAAAAAAAHGTADEDSNGQARQPRVVNFGPPLSEDEEEADGPTTEQPLSQRGRKWQQQQQQLKRKLSSATDGTGENELKEATEEEGDGGVEGRTRGAGHKKKRVPPRVSAGGSSFGEYMYDTADAYASAAARLSDMFCCPQLAEGSVIAVVLKTMTPWSQKLACWRRGHLPRSWVLARQTCRGCYRRRTSCLWRLQLLKGPLVSGQREELFCSTVNHG